MIKAIIIDDESQSIDILQLRLKKHRDILSVEAVARNINDGARLIREIEPDVVFLDIQMPGGSGFDLLKNFPEPVFLVVFVTAYDEYALKALKLNALDYLLKPIDPEELDKTVEKIVQTTASKQSKEQSLSLLKVVKTTFETTEGKIQKMVIPLLNGFEVINISDIVYCEAERNYTKVILNNKSEKIVSRTLKEFEDQLSGFNFFRIHHSHLINLNYVKNYYKGKGGYVVMTTGQSLNVSRAKKDEFIQKFIGGS